MEIIIIEGSAHTQHRVHTTHDNTNDLTILHIIILIPSSTIPSEVFIYVAGIVNTLLADVAGSRWYLGLQPEPNTSVDCHANFPEADGDAGWVPGCHCSLHGVMGGS